MSQRSVEAALALIIDTVMLFRMPEFCKVTATVNKVFPACLKSMMV
jgi:hypothetical protein